MGFFTTLFFGEGKVNLISGCQLYPPRSKSELCSCLDKRVSALRRYHGKCVGPVAVGLPRLIGLFRLVRREGSVVTYQVSTVVTANKVLLNTRVV